jgi:hypothetical protein
MELDPSDRSRLDRLVQDLLELHGDSLLAVALIGEALGPGYRPRKTPLSVVAVLRELTPDALRRTRSRVRRWRRRNLAIPLLMDLAYIEASLDVFPIEFLDISQRHLLLFGDADPFDGLRYDRAHLRLEVEEQLRGKLLHLWEAYLRTEGSERSLRSLLLETPAGFDVILRALLLLRPAPAENRASGPEEDPVAAVAQAFEIELPTLEHLWKLRCGRGSLTNDQLDAVFDGYLSEVRQLVRLIDAL